MSLLDKLLKKTAVTPEDTDKMLSEAVRDLTKSLKYEDDEEDVEEEKKVKKKHDEEDEEEMKARKKGKDVDKDDEEEEEEYKSKRTKKGKKDVREFIEEDVDVEDVFPYDEPEDEADEEAEEEVTERQKEIAKRSYKKNRKTDDDIAEMIEEDQEDVYFDDDDLPEEEFDIPEEQGHEEGIITNYGRRIKKKTKKSFYEDAMSDLVEMIADMALLLEANLKQNQKIAKSLAVMMKSQQKINADMELIKSQSPTYPMPPLMYMPTVNAKKNTNSKEYSEEQVREALVKGMTSGKVSGDLLRDFEAWISKPGAKATDWVNNMLDEPLKKTLGL